MKKLMVIIPDKLSSLIEKGEVTERYYNPDNFFSEVHIVLTNKDTEEVIPSETPEDVWDLIQEHKDEKKDNK